MAERIEDGGPAAIEYSTALLIGLAPWEGPVAAGNGGAIEHELEDVVIVKVETVKARRVVGPARKDLSSFSVMIQFKS